MSDADRKLLIDGVLEACDALDGNEDGLIFAPQNCEFDPRTLACPGDKKDGCLSAAQVNAIRAVMQGPRTRPGGRCIRDTTTTPASRPRKGCPACSPGPSFRKAAPWARL